MNCLLVPSLERSIAPLPSLSTPYGEEDIIQLPTTDEQAKCIHKEIPRPTITIHYGVYIDIKPALNHHSAVSQPKSKHESKHFANVKKCL